MIFVLIAFAETINGIYRIKFLNKRFGNKKAKIISFFTGLFFIVVIVYYALKWISLSSFYDSFFVGFLWSFLMVAYDVFIAKIVFKYSWKNVIKDFDVTQGNLLSIGIVILFLLPSILFILK